MTNKRRDGGPAETSDAERDAAPDDLSPWERRQKRLIQTAIREAFADVGIDVEERFELRKDNAFVRRFRLGSENMAAKLTATTLGAIITGALAFVGMLLMDYFKR